MKRKIAILLCASAVVCIAASATAYAANETTGTTIVTYTQEEEAGETSPALYEINIPAEVSLNDGREMYITANYLNLSSGQSVTVYLDGDKTFSEDGYFHLQADGKEDARIAINRRNQAKNTGELIGGSGLFGAAIFEGNNLQPMEYGTLYLNLIGKSSIEPGSYQGTLYFTIQTSGE